jgi:hypothetical protein
MIRSRRPTGMPLRGTYGADTNFWLHSSRFHDRGQSECCVKVPSTSYLRSTRHLKYMRAPRAKPLTKAVHSETEVANGLAIGAICGH